MRYISVPVTKLAAERLDYDANVDGDLFEVEFDEESTKRLWDCGVLDRLNAQLGVHIDNYEDERIVGQDQLERAVQIVQATMARESSREKEVLLGLLRKAQECGTGVYFFF